MKKVSRRKFFLKSSFLVKKKLIFVICQISDSKDRHNIDKIEAMTKKGHQKFRALKWKFFPKKVILKFGLRNFFGSHEFRPSKLGAKSPPMISRHLYFKI